MLAKQQEWHLPDPLIWIIGAFSILGLIIACWIYARWLWLWCKIHFAKTGGNLIPLMLGAMGIAGLILIGGAAAGTIHYLKSHSAESENKTVATQPSPKEHFLKDAVLAAWSDNPKEPLMFLGTPTQTTDRLRLLVEYSLYRNGWMSRVRFEVDPIKEPVKGQRVKVPLAHTGGKPNGGAEDLWWGTDPGSANLVVNNPVYSPHSISLTRGRIVIIGTSNKEQNAVYFEIVRAPNDANGNIKFMVLQGHEVADWTSDWEKDS